MTPPDPANPSAKSAAASAAAPSNKKFPDYVPPTKVHYDGASRDAAPAPLQAGHAGRRPRARAHVRQGKIPIGSMEDNDVVLSDDTVSRYHCRSSRTTPATCWSTIGSTNGTFINKVRVREAFLKPGCTIGRRPDRAQVQRARRRRSRSSRRAADRCGGLIGGNAQDARDLLDHREDRADRDDRRHRRRDRHRQGGRRADDPRAVAARARRRSWCSTAARCRRT